MKRCIFIVEDKLADVSGCLLTLQTILNAGFKNQQKDEWKDLRLSFFHICEDEKAQEEDYASHFRNAFRHSQEVMRENRLCFLEDADYVAVPLSMESYASGKVDELAEEIIAKQREYLEKHDFASEFIKSFPDVSGNDAAYVLLLDIILIMKDNIDQERVQSRQPVLSSCLYTKFPMDRCITYTNYSEYYGDKWVALANITSKEIPIERERLTRPRAIYIPLRDRLYQALDIGTHGEDGP